MSVLPAHRAFIGAMPWDAHPPDFAAATSALLPFDALAMGTLSALRPCPDEVLFNHGWPPEFTVDLCRQASPLHYDPLFQLARRRGCASLSPHDTPQPHHAPFHHALLFFQPDAPPPGPGWWALIARAALPFAQHEQQLISVLLHRWSTLFNQIDDPCSGRLILGHDDRLIHADSWTRVLLLHHPALLKQIVDTLHTVIAQRWSDPQDHAEHDFVTDFHNRLYWVRYRRASALPDAPRSTHWHLQLLQLQPGELPPLSRIEDQRIARAIAYIHDHFHLSPKLSQVAAAAQLSPFHFHRLFLKHVGSSPKQYLQLKQLQVARWMLRSTRASIGAIAARCGFSSHGHFTSTFTRMIKQSPSRYRENH